MQKRTKFQIRSDAAKQRWVRDDRKESFWRKHVVAWKLSGQSKRGYCIAHSLCQSSFNAWNREIAIRDREKIASANAAEILLLLPFVCRASSKSMLFASYRYEKVRPTGSTD